MKRKKKTQKFKMIDSYCENCEYTVLQDELKKFATEEARLQHKRIPRTISEVISYLKTRGYIIYRK